MVSATQNNPTAPVTVVQGNHTAGETFKSNAQSDIAKTVALVFAAAIGLALVGLGTAQLFGKLNILPAGYRAFSAVAVATGGTISVVALVCLVSGYHQKKLAEKASQEASEFIRKSTEDHLAVLAKRKEESIEQLPETLREPARNLKEMQYAIFPKVQPWYTFLAEKEYDILASYLDEVTMETVKLSQLPDRVKFYQESHVQPVARESLNKKS
jgi:uncharacterized protein HemX